MQSSLKKKFSKVAISSGAALCPVSGRGAYHVPGDQQICQPFTQQGKMLQQMYQPFTIWQPFTQQGRMLQQ